MRKYAAHVLSKPCKQYLKFASCLKVNNTALHHQFASPHRSGCFILFVCVCKWSTSLDVCFSKNPERRGDGVVNMQYSAIILSYALFLYNLL